MSGITDALLAIAGAAGAGRTDDALSRLEELRERHAAAAKALAPREANGPLGAHITTHFEDLAALNALFRPGALDAGMVDEYVRRRSGTSKPKYM